MRPVMPLCSGLISLALCAGALADQPLPIVTRGEYLVALGGCGDCHTPGHFRGHEDRNQLLAGSDVGFDDPLKGVVVGPNLTPDAATGLGSWTDQQIITALTHGILPDGQVLSPVMPWAGFSHLTSEDANAIVAYLRALPAVRRKTPGPFPPGIPPTVPVLRLTAPAGNQRTGSRATAFGIWGRNESWE